MKEAQIRKLEKQFGLYQGQIDKARRREAILKAAFKKTAERKRVAAFKKVEKREAANDPARGRANQEINVLLKLSKGSLIKLLPVVQARVRDGRYPKIVLEEWIKRIRRNQWDKLSIDEKILVSRTEASFVEQTV